MTETKHVGPIIFSHERARRRLLEAGSVLTARGSDRTTGETWWRASRTGEKQGDVVVRLSHRENSYSQARRTFENYHERAGFPSPEAWENAVRDLNDGSVPVPLWVYKVEVRDS